MKASEFSYVRVAPNGPLPGLTGKIPFKAVVVIEASYSPEWQDEASRWLVESGCRYMLAWGPDCSSWNDSVDYATVINHLPNEVPDDEHVMTTWHEDQTLEDVFWQAQFNARFSYDDVELPRTVVVHISNIDRGEWMAALFDRSKTLAERESG